MTPSRTALTPSPGQLSQAGDYPCLEFSPERGGQIQQVRIAKLPFVIGRAAEADHVLYASTISKQHAAIVLVDGRYVIRDLQSTNGTFVNGQRVGERALDDGDVVQLAQVECCFRHRAPEAAPADSDEFPFEPTMAMQPMRPDSVMRGSRLLRQMIDAEAAEIMFQPIVDLRTGTVVGHEALARGRFEGLSEQPASLFELAERCHMAVELSRLFRRLAIRSSARLPPGTRLFFNVHEDELSGAGLLESLATAGLDHPVVVEIPESSVTDVTAMKACKAALARLGIELAYDDFGSGQARLLELTDSPPDYLKVDRAIIRDIDTAEPRREMVRALLGGVRSLGVKTIAEGIETEAVAAACRELGFDLGQGFLFGRAT